MNQFIFKKVYGDDQNGILEINSGKPGKVFTIVACTHGNETAGLHVQDFLLNTFDITKNLISGKIIFLCANIEAMKQGMRQVDYDLNRVWDFHEKHKNTYEYKRAQELIPYLEESDYILDIHSTKVKSDPFFMPMQNIDDSFLPKIECSYIIKNFNNFVRGKLLTDYNTHAIASVLEAGIHTDQSTIDLSINNTLILLSHYGFIDEQEHETFNAPVYIQKDVIQAQTMHVEYLYSKNPQSFDYVEAGTEILRDGENVIKKDRGYYLLMPCLPNCLEDEMCHLLEKG